MEQSSSIVLSDEKKWQHCVENTMRKTALGFLASSVAIIFFSFVV